jgi:hypothetical protein
MTYFRVLELHWNLPGALKQKHDKIHPGKLISRFALGSSFPRILIGRPEGKRPPGRSGSRWDDYIKMSIKRDVRIWTISIWLRIGTSGRIL